MAIEPAPRARVDAFRRIATVNDVAAFLGVSRPRLNHCLYGTARPQYRNFSIAKRGGGTRAISAPPDVISDFQHQLLACLVACVREKRVVHGFARDRSVVSNANEHKGRACVLNVDLEGFFPSVHFGRVRGIFRARPFSFPDRVAAVLAHICCHKGSLPQGAPTSPFLSNVVCRGLDKDLMALARSHRARYTRYADDITFSFATESVPTDLAIVVPGSQALAGAALEAVVKKHDFKINARKVRVQSRNMRQAVTGLVVNTRVNVPREYIRNLRATLHRWRKDGEAAAEANFHSLDQKDRLGGQPGLDLHVKGKLDFLLMVRGRGDALHARYALQHAHLARGAKAVPLWGAAAADAGLLKEAVHVIIGKDAKGDEIEQGSGFFLEGVGFVSTRHTFDDFLDRKNNVVSWWLVPSPPQRPRQITTIRFEPGRHVDLAVLEVSGRHVAHLRQDESDQQWAQGKRVSFAGFPSWGSRADKLLLGHGAITQTKTVSGLKYLLVTAGSVRVGMSGGPLIAADGRVIGVLVQDANGAIAPDGAIAIEHVKLASGEPPISLIR